MLQRAQRQVVSRDLVVDTGFSGLRDLLAARHTVHLAVLDEVRPGLMELVEQEANEQARRYLLELLHPYDLRTVDAVVLGCTHYVFLRPLLREILPENVQVLDGNEGTARQLRRVLTENDLLCAREAPGKITLETSGAPETVLPVMQRLLVRADTL